MLVRRLFSSFRASDLQKTLTTTPRPLVPNKDLVFGRTFTDHMLLCSYAASTWSAPRIQPYGKISLDPSATVFHYGIECFEGMKAYKDAQGTVRLFRPDKNMERLLKSVRRLALPVPVTMFS